MDAVGAARRSRPRSRSSRPRASSLVHRRGEPRDLLVGEVGRERVRARASPCAGSRSPTRGRCRRSRAGRGAAGAAGAPSRRRIAASAGGVEAESASGPRCASSAAAASGVSSQTPARFFRAFSVRTSFEAVLERECERRCLRAGLANARASSAVPPSSGARAATSSPSSVGKSSLLPRRSAPASRRPSSAASGGSNVFSVAMCAGPAFVTGNADTGSFRARRHASISGSSGTASGYRARSPRTGSRAREARSSTSGTGSRSRSGSVVHRAQRLRQQEHEERRSRRSSRRTASAGHRSPSKSTPPARLPSGIVPHTIQRRDALARPSSRSGVSVWIRLMRRDVVLSPIPSATIHAGRDEERNGEAHRRERDEQERRTADEPGNRDRVADAELPAHRGRRRSRRSSQPRFPSAKTRPSSPGVSPRFLTA